MDQRPLQRVWVGYFLSHMTLKIPSSINKPVQSCKIVGKWSEKKHEISNHGWLGNIFYCISFMDYHFDVSFSPVQTDVFLTVYVWCCGLVTGIFLFIMWSGFVLFVNVSLRILCHTANDLIIWKPEFHFPCQNISPKSTAKFNSPVS